MEESTAHPCVQGPNRRWLEPLLLKAADGASPRRRSIKPTAVDAVVWQVRPQAAGRWACESKDRASAGRALSGDLLVQLRHL